MATFLPQTTYDTFASENEQAKWRDRFDELTQDTPGPTPPPVPADVADRSAGATAQPGERASPPTEAEVPASPPTLALPPAAEPPSINAQIIPPAPASGDWLRVAQGQLNKPYIWGSQGGRSDFSENPAGFDCLVAGTLIQTDRGAVPIEWIVPGDAVLTRAGYRPVLGAWLAGERDVWEVSLSPGTNLIGTSNQRVWTVKGWVSLSTLANSDILLTCQARPSSSRGCVSTAIPRRPVRPCGTTSSAPELPCTGLFGKLRTGRSRMATKSTTATTILSTTPSQTWNAFLGPGIDPSQPMRGTIISDNALIAARCSPRKLAAAMKPPDGFVLAAARRHGVERPDWIAAKWSARNAEPTSGRSITDINVTAVTPVLAERGGVLGVRPLGRAATYDLEIEEHHEFFANGVLVANCSGYVSYVLKTGMGIDLPAQTASAYGKTAAVSVKDARPGDVVFYNMNQDDPHLQHIAIYMGDGRIIQAGGSPATRNVNIAGLYAAGAPEIRRPTGAGAPVAQRSIGAALGDEATYPQDVNGWMSRFETHTAIAKAAEQPKEQRPTTTEGWMERFNTFTSQALTSAGKAVGEAADTTKGRLGTGLQEAGDLVGRLTEGAQVAADTSGQLRSEMLKGTGALTTDPEPTSLVPHFAPEESGSAMAIGGLAGVGGAGNIGKLIPEMPVTSNMLNAIRKALPEADASNWAATVRNLQDKVRGPLSGELVLDQLGKLIGKEAVEGVLEKAGISKGKLGGPAVSPSRVSKEAPPRPPGPSMEAPTGAPEPGGSGLPPNEYMPGGPQRGQLGFETPNAPYVPRDLPPGSELPGGPQRGQLPMEGDPRFPYSPRDLPTNEVLAGGPQRGQLPMEGAPLPYSGQRTFPREAPSPSEPITGQLPLGGGKPIGPGWWDKAASLVTAGRYSDLLSGFYTHAGNITSDTGKLLAPAVHEAGAGNLGQAGTRLKGMVDAIPDALGASWGAITSPQAIGKADYVSQLPGNVGKVINLPMNVLGAEDGFFRILAVAGERRAGAWSLAKGDSAEFARLMRSPTPEMAAAEAKISRETTFIEDVPKFLDSLVNRGDMSPKQKLAMSLLFPFVRVSWNLTKGGLKLAGAPVTGAVEAGSKLLKGDVQGARMPAAKSGLASLLMVGLAAKAANGELSGSGPSNAQERDELEATGWQRDSIKVGDKWYPLALLGPVGVEASLIANVFEGRRDQKKGADPAEIATSVVPRLANAIADQTFLRNLGWVFSTVPQAGESFIAGLARDVPFGGAIRSGVEATDPYQRDPAEGPLATIGERVKMGLPGLRETVQVKQTPLGEPAMNTRAGINPLHTSTEKRDPVYDMFASTGVAIAAPPKTVTIGGVPSRGLPGSPIELKEEDRRLYKQVEGQLLRERLDGDVIEELMKMPIDDRAKKLSGIFNGADKVPGVRDQAMKQVLDSIPEDELLARIDAYKASRGREPFVPSQAPQPVGAPLP